MQVPLTRISLASVFGVKQTILLEDDFEIRLTSFNLDIEADRVATRVREFDPTKLSPPPSTSGRKSQIGG